MLIHLRQTIDRFIAWLRGRSAAKPTPVYLNHRGEKPYYQKLTCEHQARSSTGPMARHSRSRR